MEKSTISNKMIDPKTENKINIKFNVAMHGFGKGQLAKYSSLPDRKKILVRRRLKDDDGSVEVVKIEPKPKTVPAVKKPVQTTDHKNS